jgi:hypothetical protein
LPQLPANTLTGLSLPPGFNTQSLVDPRLQATFNPFNPSLTVPQQNVTATNTNPNKGGSSIAGIPNIMPNLPKAPQQQQFNQQQQQAQVS